VHHCCTNVSRIILKTTQRLLSHKWQIKPRKNSSSFHLKKEKFQNVSALYILTIYLRLRKLCIFYINVFFFQLATGGIESAVHKKLIAPLINDLPASHVEGFRRACADHKYAFFGPNILTTSLSLSLSCQLVPLPDTPYKDQWAFIISKNSSYKGIINWRWDNKMKSIRYITDNSNFYEFLASRSRQKDAVVYYWS